MEVDGDWQPRRVFEVALGIPATDGNSVQVLRNGDEIFPAMLSAIDSAERSIDLLTFIYWTGDVAQKFASTLAAKVRDGVRVRVLLDHVGARRMDSELAGEMLDAGCDVKWFRPVGDVELAEAMHRTHRKVLVCDESVAFTGGVGIAEEWEGDARDETEWRDTHFEVRGPAVEGLASAFLTDWVETGADLFDAAVDRLATQPRMGGSTIQVIPDSDRTGVSNTALCFRLMLAGVEQPLRIQTAYFTPDADLLAEICSVAQRGVEVEIIVPGEHADKAFVRWAGESDYQQLLDAGVRLHTFDPSMLHTKVMTADSRVAVVGSSNLNSRSVSHDDEVLMAIFDPEVVAELDSHFEHDLTRSSRLVPEDWGERGILRRAREAAVSAIDRLL